MNAADADLRGRSVLITGASGSIGSTIASALATQGASLILVGRNETRLDRLVARLAGGPHRVLPLDVGDEAAWDEARGVLTEKQLHGAVAAAAVVTPIGPIRSWSIESFRATIDVNLVGTMLTIERALDAFGNGGGSIVTLSGGGATAAFPRFDAYAASKVAVVRLSENLARELAPNVRVNSVAPGFVASAMHESTLAAGPDLVGTDYYERTRRLVEEEGGDSPGLAAALVGFLLSDASKGITGKLISARWDPWDDPIFQNRLRDDPDLGTLRRIDDQFFTKVLR